MAKQTVRIQGRDIADTGSVDLDHERIALPDGTRLTESRAADLAAEVLHAAGRGRPSLTAPAADRLNCDSACPKGYVTDSDNGPQPSDGACPRSHVKRWTARTALRWPPGLRMLRTFCGFDHEIAIFEDQRHRR